MIMVLLSAVIVSSIKLIIGYSDVKIAGLPRVSVAAQIHLNKSPVDVMVVADTGAQVTVTNASTMDLLGIKFDDLQISPYHLKTAAGGAINVLGHCSVIIKLGTNKTEEEVYFASGITETFMSLKACKDFVLVHKNFPHHVTEAHVDAVDKVFPDTDPPNEVNHEIEALLPERPKKMPYPPTDEKIPKLEKWLFSAFRQTAMKNDGPLPRMSGKPHKIHIDPDAQPVAVHSPIPVPHHLKNVVKKKLDEDVERGILRKAPVGEPTDWCRLV